jgi:hypothetical protein
MPDKFTKRIIKLGKRAKQTRTNQRLQFLNRHKEKFDWDNDDLDISPDLVQPAHPTDAIPAEMQGVPFEEDLIDAAVAPPLQPSLAQQAAAALANANLLPIPNGHEIAGVHNDETAVVSDDEGDLEDEDNDVEYMGENSNAPNAPDAINVDADPS